MSLRDKIIEWTPAPLVLFFSAPYVAGNSLEKAIAKADEFWETRGLESTLDLLGEGIKNEEDIAAELNEYLRILDAIGDRKHITLSLKATQMGLGLNPDLCQKNIEQILDKAKDLDIQVTIDMEESHYVDATLNLYRTLRQKYDNVGTVLQSRLFRTEEDITKYLSGLQAHIRLCIGIYNEPPEIAYQNKKEMKENFYKLLGKLWDEGHFVGIATHDEQLLERCLNLAKERQIPQERFEVQMLLGVPREETQRRLREQGIPVRLYVPYSISTRHALAYLRRRMLENPHIIFYVLGNLWRRFRNLFSSSPKRS